MAGEDGAWARGAVGACGCCGGGGGGDAGCCGGCCCCCCCCCDAPPTCWGVLRASRSL